MLLMVYSLTYYDCANGLSSYTGFTSAVQMVSFRLENGIEILV